MPICMSPMSGPIVLTSYQSTGRAAALSVDSLRGRIETVMGMVTQKQDMGQSDSTATLVRASDGGAL
jgi:hypothetical protein